MNVYKRDNSGPYWYRFMYKGQSIRRSGGVYNKQDAYDIGVAYRSQLAKGAVGIDAPDEKPAIPTFGAAMRDFLEWSKEEYAAHPNTHKRYITSSKALLAYFGNTPLDRISSDGVEKYKVCRSRQKKAPQGKRSRKATKITERLKPATVNRELALLKHLFTRNDELVPQNPVKHVKFLEQN